MPTADAFWTQGVVNRRLALEAQAQRGALTSQAALYQRAADLRDAASLLALRGALEAARDARQAEGELAAARSALEDIAVAAWFARGSQSTTATAQRLYLQAMLDKVRQLAAAVEEAQTIATRRHAAFDRLATQADLAQTQTRQLEAQIAQSAQEAEAFAAAADVARARAAALRANPGSAGRPAPRLARALFGPGEGQTLLGYGADRAGVVLGAAPGQVVHAPSAGRIGFAGPFQRFGDVLILELDSGYAIVFVGLGESDLEVGARVRAGDAIGTMRSAAPIAPELYVEVRRATRPIDPEAAARSWGAAVRRTSQSEASAGRVPG
jgi:murein hydrolase activator